MTHTLAMEWATHGIRVNSISPGFVRTQMTAKIEAAPDFQTKMKVSERSEHPILVSNCGTLQCRFPALDSSCTRKRKRG
jgi:NAD(P)-dependent dehydrogenase (short-subunit alcohol dehydrogenase family)